MITLLIILGFLIMMIITYKLAKNFVFIVSFEDDREMKWLSIGLSLVLALLWPLSIIIVLAIAIISKIKVEDPPKWL